MEQQIQKLVARTAAWTTLLGIPYVLVFIKVISPEITWDVVSYALIWTFFIVVFFISFHVYLVQRFFLSPLGDFFDRDGREDPETGLKALTAATNLPLVGLYPLPAWFLGIISVMIFINLFSPLPILPMLKVVGIGTFTGAIISGFQSFWLRGKMTEIIADILHQHPGLLHRRERIGYRISLKALIIGIISLIIVTSLLAGLWANRALMSSAVMETVAGFLKEDIKSARVEIDNHLKSRGGDTTFLADTPSLAGNNEYSILNTVDCNFPLEPEREKFPELSCKAVRSHNRQIEENLWFEESIVTDSLLIFTRLQYGGDGWFLLRTVDWDQYTEIIQSSTVPSYLLLLYIFALAGFLAYLVAQNISNPINELNMMAHRISNGDLNVEVIVYSENEVGDLAAGMSLMASNLRTMIGKIFSMVDHLDTARHNVGAIAGQVKDGAGKQKDTAEDTVASIEIINRLTSDIEGSLADVAHSSDEVSSSVFEMESTLHSVSESIASLMDSVSETSSSITEMATSIRQVATNSSELSRIAGETAGAMVEMDASIKTIEENSRSSSEFSMLVSNSAKAGVDAVEKTIGGIEEIKTTVDNIYTNITYLTKSSKEISKIIEVIGNITKRTNLLSLNASIIAAAAGEHGKGFAIVAEEIRDLADKTASSTKEIEIVINASGRSTQEAARSIENGKEKVKEGMALANNAGKALTEILQHATSSKDQLQNIARATTEQAKSSRMLTESIDSLAGMTQQISKANESLSSGIEQILRVSENIRDRTASVNTSSQEQSKGFAMISKSVETITEMLKQIYQSTQELNSSAASVFESTLSIQDVALNNQNSADRMEGEVVEMSRLSHELEGHINQFNLDTDSADEWDA
jgi:methyl-accepting chemotaxis protein